MKLSVTHLRVLMIGVNLLLALGLATHYLHSMHVPFFKDLISRPERELPKIVNPNVFREARNVEPLDTDPLGQVNIAATWLSPEPPVVKTPGFPEETDPDVVEEGGDIEEPTEGGPLAEKGWEFANVIFTPENPLNTRVQLKKKSGSTRKLRGSSGRRSIGSRRPVRRSKRSSSMAGDSIWFNVSERRYENEDLDLKFMIHSADTVKFVYWREDDPGKFYALERVSPTIYGKKKTQIGGKREEDEDAEGEDKDKEQKRKNFFPVPLDMEVRIEKDYQDMLKGRLSSGFLEERSGMQNRRPKKPSRSRLPTRVNRGTPAGKRPSTARSGRIMDAEEKKKQLKKLNKGLKGMPKHVKDRIQKELTTGLGNTGK